MLNVDLIWKCGGVNLFWNISISSAASRCNELNTMLTINLHPTGYKNPKCWHVLLTMYVNVASCCLKRFKVDGAVFRNVYFFRCRCVPFWHLKTLVPYFISRHTKFICLNWIFCCCWVCLKILMSKFMVLVNRMCTKCVWTKRYVNKMYG
jgi:hypothetical protein